MHKIKIKDEFYWRHYLLFAFGFTRDTMPSLTREEVLLLSLLSTKASSSEEL